MAGGVNNLLSLNGKTNANNALVIVAQSSVTQGAAANGPKGSFSSLQGKTDASNRLVIKIV